MDNETDGGVRDGKRRHGRRQIDELERRSFVRMRGFVREGAVSIKAHIFVGIFSHETHGRASGSGGGCSQSAELAAETTRNARSSISGHCCRLKRTRLLPL